MKQFPPFRFDVLNECLWRRVGAQEQRIALTPKGFAVLRYLVEHASRLVTHRELLDAVWSTTVVQQEVLSSHIRDLRAALGDDPKHPKFIETLARRGYRFIAPVTEEQLAAEPQQPPAGYNRLVGRDHVLTELDQYLLMSLARKRQIAFVTGEPGIGKTAVVDEFVRRTSSAIPTVRSVRGQCIEGYAGHEPYYPVLKAVGEMCRGPGGDSIVRVLANQSPTWLVQFPALLAREHRTVLEREILGATGTRMLREISEALEAITATTPLLIVLEDLHWADSSTVDFISEIARRRTPARLMLVLTYRPLDATLTNNPIQGLKQDLLVRHLCHEIALPPLQESDIAEYLGSGSTDLPRHGNLAKVLHQHSEGNPLFMVAALDEMSARGLVSRLDGQWREAAPLEEIDIQVPESLRQMIETQIARLSPDEQRVLEVAALIGSTFSSSIGARAMMLSSQELESICEPLARRNHIVRSAGSQPFPVGALSQSYEFVHVLYREVLGRRQTPGLRCARHRQIAAALEALCADNVSEIAAELAEHCIEGLDWLPAVRYQLIAAKTAQRRFAHREAASLLREALEFLDRIPASERPALEIEILENLANSYVASSDIRCIEIYAALAARADRYGWVQVEIDALVALTYCLSWSSAERALEALEHAFVLSDGLADQLLRACSRMYCLVLRVWVRGWNARDAEEARDALVEIRAARDRPLLAPHLIGYSEIQWTFSEYRESYEYAVEGLAILSESDNPSPHLSIPFQRGQIVRPRSLLFLGQWGRALTEIDTAITQADRNGDYLPAQMLRLNKAWIHLEAMDFAGVLEICDRVVRSSNHFASGYLLRFNAILLGAAEAALGRDAAGPRLVAARTDMESQRIISDWYFCMPLEAALVDLGLSQGDLQAARDAADRLLRAALDTSELTWRGIAWSASARVALAEGDVGRAHDCVGEAVRTIEGREVPLASWRVHSTAAQLCSQLGDNAARDQHRQVSRATLLKLADSLACNPPLRDTFVSAARVADILRG